MDTNPIADSSLDPQIKTVSNPSHPENIPTKKFSFMQYILTSILTLLGFYLIKFTFTLFEIVRILGTDTLSSLHLPFAVINYAIFFIMASPIFLLFLLINGLIGFKMEKFRPFHIAIWIMVLFLINLISYLLATEICNCESNALWATALIIGYWSVTAGLTKLFLSQSKFFAGKLGIILPIASIMLGVISLLIFNHFDVNSISGTAERNKKTRIEQSKPYVERNIKNMGGFFFPTYIPDWVKPDYEIACPGRTCSAFDYPGIPQGIQIIFSCKEKTNGGELIIHEFSNKTVDNYDNFSSLSDFRDHYNKMTYSPTDTSTHLQDIQVNNDAGYYIPPLYARYASDLFYIHDMDVPNENKYSIKITADTSCYPGDMKQELIKIAESLQRQKN